MAISHSKRWIALSLTAASLAFTQGCGMKSLKKAEEDSGCQLKSTFRLDQTIQDAERRLSANNCLAEFDNYYERIIQVAKGDPKPSNGKEIFDHLKWAVDQGYISQLQGKERYSKMFNVQFYTIDSSRSIGALCPKLDPTMQALTEEFKQKKVGLIEVNNEKKKFSAASRLYNDLKLNFEAVCTAVMDSRS